jgi:hypothetical protein
VAIHDQLTNGDQKRERQRWVTALIILGAVLLFLLLVAAIAFVCWKGIVGAC